jgi:hypothetical protein
MYWFSRASIPRNRLAHSSFSPLSRYELSLYVFSRLLSLAATFSRSASTRFSSLCTFYTWAFACARSVSARLRLP